MASPDPARVMSTPSSPDPSPPQDPPAQERVPAKARAPGAKRARHQRWRRISTWVTILALVGFTLASISFFGSLNQDTSADATRDLLGRIGAAIEAQGRADDGLPASLDALRPTASSGEIVREDAYGNLVQYKRVDDQPGFRIRSLGADGIPDTADDLVWPEGHQWGP